MILVERFKWEGVPRVGTNDTYIHVLMIGT